MHSAGYRVEFNIPPVTGSIITWLNPMFAWTVRTFLTAAWLDAGNIVTSDVGVLALIIAGERLPEPVNGLTSYCQILEEFHSAKYQFGLAVVPLFCKTYRSCSPDGPAAT